MVEKFKNCHDHKLTVAMNLGVEIGQFESSI